MQMEIAMMVFLALERVEFLHCFSLVVSCSIHNESFSRRGYPTEKESDFLPLPGRKVGVPLDVRIIWGN